MSPARDYPTTSTPNDTLSTSSADSRASESLDLSGNTTTTRSNSDSDYISLELRDSPIGAHRTLTAKVKLYLIIALASAILICLGITDISVILNTKLDKPGADTTAIDYIVRAVLNDTLHLGQFVHALPHNTAG